MISKEPYPPVSIRTRAILAARGLTVSEVARRSRSLFPDDNRFHIPPNLYHTLQHRGFSPSIQQLFVLSRLSGYRLVDWLALFGVVLDDIPRLQAILPARYTTLIDDNVYDDQSWILSFEPITHGPPAGSLRPLGEWLRIGAPRRHPARKHQSKPEFLYAKIGYRDAWAFPELLPGSIVRIAKQAASVPQAALANRAALFLVEHGRGLACCRLHVVDQNRVVLCPIHLPFAHVELELEKEARIVGAVDFELRSAAVPAPTKVSRALAQFWIPPRFDGVSTELRLDLLLRRARRRSGLTFREASAKSMLIARSLQNEEFFCAAGSLSDYETPGQTPRHIHKMLSLCTLYSVDAWEFMRAAGVVPSQAGSDPMPDELRGQVTLRGAAPVTNRSSSVSGQRHTSAVEFPYFFGRAVAELFQMPHLSIRDIFWVGGSRESFHPYLADAAALIVDRRKKRIVSHPSAPLWAQPSYILLGHDGQYICTSCGSEGKMLVMRPFSNGFQRPLRMRTPGEIEIIGTVVGILRRLSDGW